MCGTKGEKKKSDFMFMFDFLYIYNLVDICQYLSIFKMFRKGIATKTLCKGN